MHGKCLGLTCSRLSVVLGPMTFSLAVYDKIQFLRLYHLSRQFTLLSFPTTFKNGRFVVLYFSPNFYGGAAHEEKGLPVVKDRQTKKTDGVT